MNTDDEMDQARALAQEAARKQRFRDAELRKTLHMDYSPWRVGTLSGAKEALASWIVRDNASGPTPTDGEVAAFLRLQVLMHGRRGLLVLARETLQELARLDAEVYGEGLDATSEPPSEAESTDPAP